MPMDTPQYFMEALSWGSLDALEAVQGEEMGRGGAD